MEQKDLTSPLLWDAENRESVCVDKEMFGPNAVQIKTKQASHKTLKKFATILYYLFLLVRLILLTIYAGRAINCCTKEKKASFQCANGAFVAHDMEAEAAWIILSIINMVLGLTFLFLWHKTPGMKSLVLKLMKLPGFWSLIFLFLVSCSGLFILSIKNNTSFFQIAMFFLFGAHNVSITTIVVILNYTQVSHFIEQAGYRQEVRILIKLTQALLFVEFFVLFLIGTMQFGFQVTGLDYSTKASSSFRKIFAVMRRFGEAIFYYRVENFLWTKLFVDNKNILSHMEVLHDYYHE